MTEVSLNNVEPVVFVLEHANGELLEWPVPKDVHMGTEIRPESGLRTTIASLALSARIRAVNSDKLSTHIVAVAKNSIRCVINIAEAVALQLERLQTGEPAGDARNE